ncbi:MAG: peptidoglycan-binding protein LysM, partial [Actinomycetes bacterium]
CPPGPPGRVRIDPDLADSWAPDVVLVRAAFTSEQARRLSALVMGDRSRTLAVVAASPLGEGGSTLVLDRAEPPGALRGRLDPEGITLVLHHVEPRVADQVVELVEVTGSQQTEPATWWVPEREDDPPPHNVVVGRRFGGWGAQATNGEVETVTAQGRATADAGVQPPVLRLLGPVDLVGAAGVVPPRASKQCLEYCGWLLEHPGSTAQAMASGLVVAEGTRRSNMSRLRSWLGASPEGEPYLPDAYTGRIRLHPSVSSDWHQLRLFTAPGVNRASDGGLRLALELVRGAPLADAAPGQWHWAEELRTDLISAVRDIGVELANRALAAGDLDLARWAAARALVAAPGDELLLAMRVRTEHQAGNSHETERLSLQLVAQARTLGVDLAPDTVTLLQQVMEGRVRARMA